MNATQIGTLLSLRAIRLFILALALAALHGCATIAPATDADSLRQRAEAYWKARVAGDLITAWEYEEHKARGTSTLQAYVKRNPPIFTKVIVVDAKVLPEGRGVVAIDASYTVPGLSMKPIQQRMQHDWVLIEKQWYIVNIVASTFQKK